MKKFRSLFLFVCFVLPSIFCQAQNFEDWFEDRTLRVDYIFAGDSVHQELFLDELCSVPSWAGRRRNLDSLYLQGNGQVIMQDIATGQIIYKTSFSSLFQEWQGTQEAGHVRKSFENSFLLPFPKKTVNVTVQLTNNRREITSTLTHRVDPRDILIRHLGEGRSVPNRFLLKNGYPSQCIDIVFVAEGYTNTEMDIFYKDAEIATEALFEHEPFKTYKDRFNVVAVGVPSTQSGVSIPKKGLWKETALNSHFDTFYSDRYLTTLHLKDLHNILAGIPYEHILILANTENYGGGGIFNSYTLTTTHNPQFRPVVVHEFGHSFAGLADEYFYDDEYTEMYPKDVEPWEKNITTLVDFDSKWKNRLSKKTPIPTKPDGKNIYSKIGVYEGAGYQSKGVYRPCQECRMKVNDAPEFCPVCRKSIEELIHYYTR